MTRLVRSHPLVGFLWLGFVLWITVFSRNPVLLAESLLFSALFAALLGKGRTLFWALPAAVIAALLNPLFSHSGATALFFVGNTAITLDALVQGALFGTALLSALLWSAAGTAFMTSDKFVWLFGRVFPSAGLTLSCALRFVPLFIRRTREFFTARRDSTLRGALKAFSAAISYSAEEAMSCADSMKARGYGSGKRTFFSLYRLSAQDKAGLALVLLFGAGTALAAALGAGKFLCYPALSRIPADPFSLAMYAMFAGLCTCPIIYCKGGRI